jgi:hypothetical protein
MYLTASGISSAVNFKIHPSYKVKTNYAMDWFQCADGNWYATDRGANSDIYESEIILYGNETTINTYLTEVKNMRDMNENLVYMYDFASDEHIFGEDVDYSNTLSGVFTKIGDRKQSSFKVFTTSFELRLLSPSFTGSAILPDFTDTCVEFGYINSKKRSYTITDSYYGNTFVSDSRDESNIFKGSFNLTDDQIQSIRRWNAVNRTASINITNLNGITYMFGPEEGTTHNVKLLSIKEKSKIGLTRWLVDLEFAKSY